MPRKSTDDPSQDEIQAVWDVMLDESHRGCVLVGAALIEWHMGELLKSKFLRMQAEKSDTISKQIDVMLDPMNEKSVLGSAAARARMLRVLGLISEDTHVALKEFLVFRNKHFAHARREAKLTDPAVKKDLDRLVAKMPQHMQKHFTSKYIKDERDTFIQTVVSLYFQLIASADYYTDNPR